MTAERTHIFDNEDELTDYLFAFVAAFQFNSGLQEYLDSLKGDEADKKNKEVFRALEVLVDNIRGFAEEYRLLNKEGKIEAYGVDLEAYKQFGWKTLDEVHDNVIKANKETIKYATGSEA